MTILTSANGSLPLTLRKGETLVIRNYSGVETVLGSRAPRESASEELGSGAWAYGPQPADVSVTLSSTGSLDYSVLVGDVVVDRFPVNSRTSIASRRAAARAASSRAALNQAPAWSAGATIMPTDVRRLSGGQEVIAQTGGTTGGTEPVFSATAAITDNTVTWWALNETTSAAPAGAPAVVVTDNAGISALTVQYNLFNDQGRFDQPSAPNVFIVSGSGATARTQAWTMRDSTTTNNGFGANGQSGKYRTIEFETDADTIEIGYMHSVTNYIHERLRVWVNDYPATEAPLVPTGGSAGTNRFWRLAITGPARKRRIRMACHGSMLLSYVAVGTGKIIEKPQVRAPLCAWFSDSFFDTESPSYDIAHYDMGVLVSQKLGFPHCASFGVGGTSYTVNNGARLNCVSVLGLTDVGQFAPDVIVFAHGGNAANTGVVPATEAAGGLTAWTTARTACSASPVLVFGSWYRHPSYLANQDATNAALKDAFLQWGDANSAFIDPHDGSITLGNGTIVRAAGAGWFNSSNASWAIPVAGGGFDGSHPSPTGVNYVGVPEMVSAGDAALTALGY